MTELWGAVAGSRQAAIDQQDAALKNLSMQKEEVSIAQSLITMQQQAKMLQAMGGGQDKAPPTPDQLAANMDRMSATAAQVGLFDKAEKFATAGSQIRRNQSAIETQKANQNIKQLNVYSSLLQDVNDESSWQRANAMYQIQTGQKSPYASLPYNPEVVGKLQVGVESAKDRALTQAAQARERASDAAAAEAVSRRPLIEAQTRVANDRADALEKAGAVTKAPKADQIKAITDLLVTDFGATLAPEDSRVLARPVAERMVELMKSNNLTSSEAATKAYQEAKDHGDFAGIRARMQMSGTLRNPIKVEDPAKLDKAKLKVNMVYNVKGTLYTWTGTGFRPAKPAAVPVVPDETDDETDDEEP